MKKKTDEKPAVITSFEQLEKLVASPVICRFEVDGQIVELPVNRITPQIAERRRTIVRSVQPPFKKERNDYDPLDAKYLQARDQAEMQARALVVYSCCPGIAAKKPGLTNDAQILEFVQSLLTENLLDLIALTAQAGGLNVDLEVARRANFTSTPASES